MKCIILAGGWGSRLGQLSESVPKPMIKIGDKPILWHIMKIYSQKIYQQILISFMKMMDGKDGIIFLE